ncbi:MAG: SIMPL domain-containing protein [Bacteroidia bacterium]|nr:SIMPL domain-containing protein [Bacteroidia bacterium]MBP9689265.1 SIMPL domain-containing protein [Bacteroidia bacterium]
MNKIKHLLTLLFLLNTIITFGQNTTSKPQELPYIEVTGTAEKEVIPDEIYISIVIREKYENRVKVTIENQEENLKAAILSIGIDGTNLSLSDANADYVKVKWQRKDVLTKKDFLLKVTNATSVGQVFQKLDELQINDAYISKVSHSKIDSLRKVVKILAIKAAKEKADYLLNEIGEQTGKPLIVTEGTITNNLPQRNANMVANTFSGVDSRYAPSPKFEIEFQKIKLSASIYVKFAIKQ